MKKAVFILAAWLGMMQATAQNYTYKNGVLSIDGAETAKIVATKEFIGLANTYEVFNMDDEKLIVAAWAGEYEQDPNNNMDFYYRLEFLQSGRTGIFTIAKLGPEKSLAKLLGTSGIFADGKIDEEQVKNLIATKGKTPKVAIDYRTVDRNTGWPIQLKESGMIEQDGKTIGSFKDVTLKSSGMDTYEFHLPSGVLVAVVSFSNGNNAQQCDIRTMKDDLRRIVPIPTNETVTAVLVASDRNKWALERIIKWLVGNGYL
jgi:hypothetical protein